jgi:hypothetical protein
MGVFLDDDDDGGGDGTVGSGNEAAGRAGIDPDSEKLGWSEVVDTTVGCPSAAASASCVEGCCSEPFL